MHVACRILRQNWSVLEKNVTIHLVFIFMLYKLLKLRHQRKLGAIVVLLQKLAKFYFDCGNFSKFILLTGI